MDTQEYAFAMRKNSPWLSKINRALNAAIANGLVQDSYIRNLRQSCPPLSTTMSVKPLGLRELGTLFMAAGAAAVLMAMLKIWLMVRSRNRPRLPLRSISTTSAVDGDVLSRYPEKDSMMRMNRSVVVSRMSLSVSSVFTNRGFQH